MIVRHTKKILIKKTVNRITIEIDDTIIHNHIKANNGLKKFLFSFPVQIPSMKIFMIFKRNYI